MKPKFVIDNNVWCQCGFCWKDKTQEEADATCPDGGHDEPVPDGYVLTSNGPGLAPSWQPQTILGANSSNQEEK